VKIERLTGSISFKGGTVERTLNLERFLESPIGRSAKEDFVNEEWRHYHIEPQDGVVGTVLFQGQRLERIFLTMRMPSDQSEEWTAALELERKAKHDAWLQSTLGPPPYIFPWGTIASEFDAKGCASDIIVTYAT
jgi:hypothetical protein